ncbi:MAG: PilZ domain-containing protein [Chloroflexi bacterium]|nr:MAG: PilZ domain-containing protein [Chloroflexota bacterium]
MINRRRNRRQFERHDAPAGIRPASPEVFHRFLDISIGGMRVLSRSDWQPGDVVRMEIRLPVGSALSASVEVVWIRRVTFESEVTNEVGLRFTDLTDFDRSRIAALLASRGTPR